jgi:hypothetical protein
MPDNNQFEEHYLSGENIGLALNKLKRGIKLSEEEIYFLEKAISRYSPDHSYWYANRIIEGRFIEGEEIISKSSTYSYFYAVDVIKGRFVAGEDAIFKDKDITRHYCRLLMNS